MTAIHAPGLLTFTIAILVFFAGAGLNRLIEPLRRWNIPEPVTGGLIAAVATLLAYLVLGVEISFTLDARDMLLLYFFTGIGLNARLDDLISGGRPLLVLLALTLVYLVIQNLIAAGSVAALGLPRGITAFVGSASLIGGHGTTIRRSSPSASALRMRSKSASRRRRSGWWWPVWSAVRSPVSSSRVIVSPDRRRPTRWSACRTTRTRSPSTI